jgi:cytochrome c oxidase subunit 4
MSDSQSSTSHIHISPLWLNLTIFGALMVLTALTVWAAFQDFGPMDFTVAFAIALVKATLVVLFFMHVKYSSKLVMICAATGFLFLIFLFAFPFADYATRSLVPGWPASTDVSEPLEQPDPETPSPGRGSPGGPGGAMGPGGV